MAKFVICSLTESNFKDNTYWLYIKSNAHGNIEYDKDIAKTIGITMRQYQKELLQFNTETDESRKYYDKFKTDVVFYKQEDVKNALSYLNDKYGIILVLIG